MAEIVYWQRKPETDRRPQVTARYLPPERSLATFLQIARMADSGAQVRELSWAGLETELCVRYRNSSAERPFITYVHVPAGHWLAYDPAEGFLYESAQQDWERFYFQASAPGEGGGSGTTGSPGSPGGL